MRNAALVALFLLFPLLLSGCGGGTAAPTLAPTPTPAAATPSATPTPEPPHVVPVIPDPDELYVVESAGGGPAFVAGVRSLLHTTWSPDGSRLAYVEEQGYNTATLHVVAASGWQEEWAIDLDARPESPVWSPDGSRIAVVVSDEEANALLVIEDRGRTVRTLRRLPGTDIRIVAWRAEGRILVGRGGLLAEMGVDDGRYRQVSDTPALFDYFGAPELSPDGTKVAAVVRINGQTCRTGTYGAVQVIDLVSGDTLAQSSAMCGAGAVAWSPGSALVAFSVIQPEDPARGVYIFDPAAAAVRRLTSPEYHDGWLRWTPAGTLLVQRFGCVYCSPGSAWLAIVSVADGVETETPGHGLSDVSPDGRVFAFGGGNSFEVGLLDGSVARTVAGPDPGWGYGTEGWSPDGRWIAFSRGHLPDRRGYEVNTDGTGLNQVVEAPSYASISPDGARIGFSEGEPQGRHSLWLANADGSGRVLIADGNGGFIWAPDSSQLIVGVEGSADATGEGESYLLLMNADGSGSRRLDAPEELIWNGAWSPDGRYIAYIRAREEVIGYEHRYITELRTWDIDTGQSRWLTERAASTCGLAWSPDGRMVLYGGTKPHGGCVFMTVDVQTRVVRQVTATESSGFGAVFSPDGRRLARLLGGGAVAVVDMETLEERSFGVEEEGFSLDDPIAWSPDSERLAFYASASEGPGVFVANADGSGLYRLVSTKYQVPAIAWRSDERLFFVTAWDFPP